MKLIKVIFIVISFGALSNTSAEVAVPKIKFKKLTNPEFKKVTKFNKAVKDKDGYLWIVTAGNLLRYNGYNLKRYNKDSNEINVIDEAFYTIAYNKKSGIWIGSEFALINYEQATKKQKLYIRSDPKALKYINNTQLIEKHKLLPTNGSVRSLYFDEKGGIWYGSGYELIYVDPINLKTSNYSPWFEIKDPQLTPLQSQNIEISGIEKSDKDTLWLSTINRGLIKFDKRNHTAKIFRGNIDKEIRIKSVNSLVKRDKNNILIATDSGLYNVNTLTEKITHFPNKKNKITENLNAVSISDKGDIWTAGSNVYHIDKKNRTVVYEQKLDFQISDEVAEVGEILIDKQDTIYIFFNDFGVYKASPHSSKLRLFNNIINSKNNVKAITKGKNNDIWVGFTDGLIKASLENNILNYTPIFHKDESKFLDIKAIHVGNNNNVWVAEKKHITLINDKDITRFDVSQYISGNSFIYSIVEDFRGNLWFSGHRNGVFILNPNTGKVNRNNILAEQQLEAWQFIDLLISENKKVLTFVKSTRGFGEFDIQNNRFIRAYTDKELTKPYEHHLNLRETAVWGISKNKKKNQLWLAHAERYISKFDYQSGKSEVIDTPIKEPIVGLIVEEPNFWLLGENSGIHYWNMKSNELKTFSEKDGLPNSGISGFTSLKINDKILFGSKNGLVLMSQDSYRMNPHHSRTTISEIRVNGKNVPLSIDEYFLNHNENNIEFRFFADSSAYPETLKYRYRLLGFQNTWKNSEAADRKANYTNLDQGDYIFEVQSSNNDGVWGDKITQVKISISPAWWASPIAYVLYVTLGTLLIMLGYQLRVKSIQRKNQQLQNIIEEKTTEVKGLLDFKNHFILDLTHELKTMLQIQSNEYQSLFSALQKKPIFNPKQLDYSNKKMVRIIDQLLHLAKLQSREKLKVEVFDCALLLHLTIPLFKHFAEKMKINIEVNVPNKGLIIKANRNAIERILTNLIGNAIKYNRKNGSVSIKAFEENDKVIVQISDTGYGIPQEKLPDSFRYTNIGNALPTKATKPNYKSLVSHGVGLHLVEELVAINQGEIKVDVLKNIGTTFVLSFSLSHETLDKNLSLSHTSQQMIDMETQNHSIEPLSIEQLQTQLTFDDNRETVLIIDDHKILLESILSYMNQRFNLLLAINGEEGLQLAEQHYPDIIITDLNMPVMDGFEFIKKVKNNDLLAHIPVILLTAIANEGTQTQGLQLGAEDVIFKPATPMEIKQKIINRLETNRRLWQKYLNTASQGLNEERLCESQNELSTPLEIEEANGQSFLNRLHDYVDNNLSDPKQLKVAAIAKHMCVSEKAVSTKIRQITGFNRVSSYLKDYRLSVAHKQLSSKYIGKIEPLAMELGFSFDQFSRTYKEKYGETPSETRAKFEASQLGSD